MTKTSPPNFTRDELVAMITSHVWYFAKTMADNPHEYTLRASNPPRHGWDDDPAFDRFVEYIRHNGVREKYGGYWYDVWYFEDFKYWTMGAAVAETTLVNRKHRQFYRHDYPISTAGSESEALRGLLAGAGQAGGEAASPNQASTEGGEA